MDYNEKMKKTINEKKNIVISDSRKNELESFMKKLNSNSKIKFDIKVHIADLTLKGIFKETRRYLSYFLVPIYYFLKRNNYNVIVGWQQFYALIFCFYCSLFHVKKKNIVVAWNFTYKDREGKLKNLYLKFMKKCVESGYLDLIHVPSAQYAEKFCKEFNYPRECVIVAPFGIVDNYEIYKKLDRPIEFKDKKYYLAIGRSNRDYDFLIKSWKNISTTLVIASDTYSKEIQNENIVLKKNISADTQYKWINNAESVILPIDNGEICSGDTVLLTAMSLKKIVIVTIPSTLAEMYIKDKENGLVVEKNVMDLKKIVQEIEAGKYDFLRQNARNCFVENYTRERMGETLAAAINDFL